MQVALEVVGGEDTVTSTHDSSTATPTMAALQTLVLGPPRVLGTPPTLFETAKIRICVNTRAEKISGACGKALYVCVCVVLETFVLNVC